MKHKVKYIGTHEDIITLRVDGVPCSYLIQRPQPLGSADATMLRNVMDTKYIELLTASVGFVHPRRDPWAFLAKLFSGVWERRARVSLFGEAVADYIEKVGVEVDIDEKTRGVVLLKSDIGEIRKGRID